MDADNGKVYVTYETAPGAPDTDVEEYGRDGNFLRRLPLPTVAAVGEGLFVTRTGRRCSTRRRGKCLASTIKGWATILSHSQYP